MGDVYLAEQSEPVRRRVALKLIRTTIRHPDVVARFRAEQEAMARLSHPNVAKLFDAGTSDQGFPYFAMELVDGEPITALADERRLPIRERVKLLIETCRGVEHAHRRGILHRDLKPANVLVEEAEGRLVPRIIDFGVAKAVEDPLSDRTLTVGRQALGTPAYMSPEALRGERDLDTRADVFSLGTILFELVVGVRPDDVDGSTRERWRQRLAAGDPPRPSTRFLGLSADDQVKKALERSIARRELVRVLSGDLGWIAWKAVAPDREDRYGSVAELAADLGAWLDDLPVSAHPPSPAYRVRKLVRRHRGVALALAVAVLATAAGLVGTTLGFLRASAAAERATREAETAREVSDFLVELFEISDPRRSHGETVPARELLDRGAERIRAELDDQPETRDRLMEVMGRVYTQLGLLAEAEPLLRDAADRAAARAPDAAATADVLEALGFLYYKQFRNPEAIEAFERALAIRRTTAADATVLARSIQRLGDALLQAGRYEEAEVILGEALQTAQGAASPDRELEAEILSRLGVVTMRRGRLEEAVAFARRSVELREELLGPGHLEVANSLNALGGAYLNAEEPDRAAEVIERALEIRRAALDPDHPDIGQSLLNLAITSDDFEVAIPRLEEALGIWERSLGPEHPRIANLLGNMVWYYLREERREEAEQLMLRSYRINLGEGIDPRARTENALTLGRIAAATARPAEAEEWFRTALRHAQEGGLPDTQHWVLQTLEELERLLREDLGRPDEAEAVAARLAAAQEAAERQRAEAPR